METSAESWSTGRAVARIPRVQGAEGLTFWSGCFWKYVSWGPHVCTNQDLAALAPQSKYNAEAMAICSALLPQPYRRWSCLKVIVERKFLNFLWWWKIKLKATRRPSRLCFASEET